MERDRNASPPPPKEKAIPPSPPGIIRDSIRSVAYSRVGFLGEGGFARVYEVLDARGGRHAIKCVAKTSLKSKKSRTKLYAEIKLHRALQHPNIVGFEECFEDDDNVYMTLELCEVGSMMDMLRRRKRYTEPEARFFLIQVIGACQYMHSHQVIHRDLKLGNLFLDRDMNVKVGDFGLAALIEKPGERKKTICGTPNYIAPEVLFDTANGHSFEVDTWSIGVILYTLVVGKPPFQTKDVKTIYKRIRDNKYEFPPERPISPDVQNLISVILTPVPEERPTLIEILEHPFFTQGIVPSHIPISAQDVAPSFRNVTRQASRANLRRLRALAGVPEDDDPSISMNTSIAPERRGIKTSTAPSAVQQEREFQKVINPGSPISALLSSARQPLLVAPHLDGSTPGQTHAGRQREQPLYRKLAAAAAAQGTGAASINPNGRGSALRPLQEEEQEQEDLVPMRNNRELESLKARIVAQMAAGEREEAEEEEFVNAGEVEADAEMDGLVARVGETALEPRRENGGTTEEKKRSSGKEKMNIAPILPSTARDDVDAVLEGAEGRANTFDAVALTLAAAFEGKDAGRVWRDPALDTGLGRPRVFIVSWVDYCNKYGMGYALADGSVGVHFNDSTSIVLAPDKIHLDYISSRRNGTIYVRKNYTMREHPEDLKSKVYLLRHFEKYMMERLYGDPEYAFEDVDRTKGMDFVQKYLRMKHVIVFKMSHEVLQFNFYDHSKVILASQGHSITHIDKHYTITHYTLSGVMERVVAGRWADAAEKKFYDRLLSKLKYSRDVLQSIRRSTANAAAGGADAGDG
ncbi:Serine/Threonine kinase catalytic domain protein [Rhizoctonia solani AG-3 Rhs1AP]|uniref:Serine/threonine-protein kinase n=2 Tax=Rhizoctonia solani AG-3 TaxID=1086053 RepID=A0A074RXG7_9AGAM|nr:Serine/Threonine kinase catalytic domain protein [Rhizoctonia solani AG-3 Rhs1AP]KEP51761.1 Serine/Threonine kinase catalytic domain protein [Rhizoctonia solani 123E]